MTMISDAKQRSEALKQLRNTHNEGVKRAQDLVKIQKKVQNQVCQLLRGKSMTVPEIAASINLPLDETLWYLTAFKKYNLIQEDGMCGEYVLYKLAGKG